VTLEDWAKHTRRAEALALKYPAAAEILTYYARREEPQGNDEGPPAMTGAAVCPLCRHNPQTAALRPEADGSRRSLICSRCAHEWPFARIECPNCHERTFDNLPVYIAPGYAHLRVECCNTCQRYLIAADLVKDPEAVPLVDDLAAIALHLWAEEHGYTRIEPGWFGI
jgi:formate dehydrogenase accessory protein FdhE